MDEQEILGDDGQMEQAMAILESLGQAIVERRKEAVDARAASGIEKEWQEDEEAYSGIDDGNRHEFANTTMKPGSAITPTRERKYGSTVVPNITAPYVDAAAARIGDMLLPTDDRNFSLKATPIPELSEVVKNLQARGAMVDVNQVEEQMESIKAEATEKARRSQERVDDWLVECDYHGHLRALIDDCAKLGSGVIKGPYPKLQKNTVWNQVAGQMEMSIQQKTIPASKRISCWDLFPDKDCGANLHNGDYVFERDRLSETKLRDLRGQQGYINRNIDLVLEQGPSKEYAPGQTEKLNKTTDSKDLFEIWYYYGIVKKEEIEAAGCQCSDDQPTVNAILTLVNDVVIRASMNPLEGGDFPYDVIPWKARQNMPWGMGVSREIRTPQRMVTAATRNLMDNAGLAAGPQIIYRKNGMKPRDGKWEIVPLKYWEADDDTVDVDRAFRSVTFPMLINELQALIQIGMKFAEDVTGLPMLLQGQQGTAPDTVGGMTMLNNNASAVLRRIARLFDSRITEPHIRRYYEYLMAHGEDPDEKGDCEVDARGSSALVERDIQNQELIQVLQLSTNPAFGWNPKKAGSEYLKSRRFDPAQFEYSEEELEELSQQEQPQDPAIEVATIRAESAKEVAAIRADVDMKNDASDTDRDLIYVQSETQRTQQEHTARMAELTVKRELALLDYANKRNLNLDKVKAELARTAMTLQTQTNLAHTNNQAKQVAKPAFEPKGRAPNGQAFQR